MLYSVISGLFLAVLCLIPVVAIGVDVARSRYSPIQYLYWSLARLLTRFLWGARTEGTFPLADHQGGVLICNHRSSVDPFFLQTALHRKVHWMVAREYVEHPALSWFLKPCEVIPANRAGIDIASTKMAIRLTKAGGLVGLLPEGTINITEQFMRPVRPGAAHVALKAGVPIVPCYIEGAPYAGSVWSPLFMPARVQVHFGPLIDVADYAGREGEAGVAKEMMLRAVKAIAQMAGQTDFEPTLAGRNWNPRLAHADMEEAEAERDGASH